MKPKIFISYSREDSGAAAGRLYDHLQRRVGAKRLFKDVDTMEIGVDFADQIKSAIDQSNILILVIGRNFITEQGTTKNNRLFNENNFVRLELEYALAKGKPIVPVLVNGATMPTVADLPESLHPILILHGAFLRNERWRGDFEDLYKSLKDKWTRKIDYSRLAAIIVAALIPILIFGGIELYSNWSEYIYPRTMTDPDGQVYKTVRLVGKTWMAENLNYKIDGSWCYNDSLKYCKDFGRLYKWKVAKKACEACGKGWRLPIHEEAEALLEVGYYSLINKGSSGFDALLGGYRSADGSFRKLNVSGSYWLNGTDLGAPYGFGFFGKMSDNPSMPWVGSDQGQQGFSVRCLRD